jgi:predicted RNase H-like nuclease
MTEHEQLRTIRVLRASIEFHLDALHRNLLHTKQRQAVKDRLDALISELRARMNGSTYAVTVPAPQSRTSPLPEVQDEHDRAWRAPTRSQG